MPVRVLVVDDSGFFRRRLTEMLNADPRLEVVGAAVNGAEAVEQVVKLRPDVVTMDIEMPVMDGIAATRRIMSATPTPILMFSSLTTDGAKATLDALDAGAVDYLPKKFEDISRDQDEAKRMLCERVYSIGSKRGARPQRPPAAVAAARPAMAAAPAARPAPVLPARRGQYRLVAIGTSTGGPVALQQVLTKLPGNFPLPLLLIQHMPGSFTPAFAQRLNQQCAIEVREAQDGDEPKPGLALLAPGGKQMVLEQRAGRTLVRITESAPGQNYKPSVDVTFNSVARIFPGQVLAVVLTGMGADGREGARLLKQGGSNVWAQDEASCVVYGMPAAIVEAGLADAVLPLSEIGAALSQRV
ncbi:MAG: chemotaxis response regulator protein-glutamate methylesterase [Gammaproteobacteria bacterium HGW-Gammaproteobacteria-1]|jgi:two-component system chemotaxis response regulator CheB|nr:MAG: chemotaxis response regulator protein-glutamate methylesterase [Gammaproteobacteria bacterium HGW-Gammaproteobacteria-1]